jgi:hypothetical protein
VLVHHPEQKLHLHGMLSCSLLSLFIIPLTIHLVMNDKVSGTLMLRHSMGTELLLHNV